MLKSEIHVDMIVGFSSNGKRFKGTVVQLNGIITLEDDTIEIPDTHVAIFIPLSNETLIKNTRNILGVL